MILITTVMTTQYANIDNDGDGFWSKDECDDDNVEVYPGAPGRIIVMGLMTTAIYNWIMIQQIP